jgi:hypothetical protein
MDMENSIGQMEGYLKANKKMMKRMAMENTIGKMAGITKGNGV